MTQPLLGLVMLVRNEEASIKATLESVRGVVDSVAILDTGSTDKTRLIASEVLAGMGVPYFIAEEGRECFDVRHDVIHYAKARNRALDIHAEHFGNVPYTLFLSGEETLEGGEALRRHLVERGGDAWCVHVLVDNESGGMYPRVLKTGSDWRYEFRLHEVPLNRATRQFVEADRVIGGVTVHHRVHDKKKRNESIRKHLPILEEMLAEMPGDQRLMTLLAQTHEICATLENSDQPGSAFITHTTAAMGYHMRAAELGGPWEVSARAHLKALDLAAHLGLYKPDEFVSRCDDLCKRFPLFTEGFLLRAVYMSRCRPVGEVMNAAKRVIDVEKERAKTPTLFPPPATTLWSAYFLLAQCCVEMAKRGSVSKWMGEAAKYAEAGVKAGAPPEKFNALVGVR